MSTNLLPTPISRTSKFTSPNGQISPTYSAPVQKISPTKTPNKYPYPKLTLPRNRHTPVILPKASTTLENPNEEETWIITQAREAVTQILQEAGVSKEDSITISSKSDKYVQMLIDGVRELDELSLWNTEYDDIDNLSFKNKVLYLAKQKGDNGILPFLESMGINSSSSTHIARYLVKESLPQLIHKVL